MAWTKEGARLDLLLTVCMSLQVAWRDGINDHESTTVMTTGRWQRCQMKPCKGVSSEDTQKPSLALWIQLRAII